jgi:uncharacterized protein
VPSAAAAPAPLSDAELDALDAMFTAIPESREPYNLSMADGFLTGVLVHPRTILPTEWLPRLVDPVNGTLDFGTPEVDLARFTALVMRRYNELALQILAREPFDPIVSLPLDEKTGEPDDGPAAIPMLAFWCAGFLDALNGWPGLDELDDEALAGPLEAVVRHLPPPEDDDGRTEHEALLDELEPYATLPEALDDLVASVLEIADLTRPRTQVRAQPKVGRNEPCPCGSGRKYKQCHGAG